MAVVEAAGVGYALNISLNTYTTIQGNKEVKLYVHESLITGGRDDSYTFFGFASKQERELYRLLISVSGVGANTASGNERLLKGVKGIGLKTAQRIIVDLKDKVLALGIAQEVTVGDGSSTVVVNNEVTDEAVSALTMLGFSPAPSAKVVKAILTESPDMPVEMVVKEALKRIK